MSKLLFYSIDDEYIDFLQRHDEKVMPNKQSRPYLGPVMVINGARWFVPGTAPKEKHFDEEGNLKSGGIAFFNLFNSRGKREFLGRLRFPKMIPVPEGLERKLRTGQCTHTQEYVDKHRAKIIEQAKQYFEIAIATRAKGFNLDYCSDAVDFVALEAHMRLYEEQQQQQQEQEPRTIRTIDELPPRMARMLEEYKGKSHLKSSDQGKDKV